jgi:hypothetical protein
MAIGQEPESRKAAGAAPNASQAGSPSDNVVYISREPAQEIAEHGYFAFFDVVLVARGRCRAILGATLALTAAVFLLSVCQQKWYRAEAVLRPEPTSERLSEFASEASMALTGGRAFSAVLDAQEAALDGEKLASILQSHMFTARLIHRHHLEGKLMRELDVGEPGKPLADWDAWLAMEETFKCDVNLETGNVRLFLLDVSPAGARRILGFYIADLRKTLRDSEVDRAEGALQSLQAEAQATPDRLLAQQLYVLVARQKERERVAQADADFAFTVIDAPDCRDRPYSPRIILNTAIAAGATFVSCIVLIAFEYWFRRRWGIYSDTRRRATASGEMQPRSGYRGR